MKKFLRAALVLPLVLFAVSCSESNDNGGGNDDPIKLSPGTELKQEAFADEEQALAPIKFTATAPWKATVAEIQTKAEAGRVDWLKLDKYEGEKGDISLTMTLSPNYTGTDRKAEIRIACGGTIITVTVEQKGTKADGTLPEDPNKPEQPDLKNRIVRIDHKDDFYNESSRLEFSYDELGRLIQVSETWWGDSNVTDIITGKITYGDKTVACEIIHKEESSTSQSTSSTVLDENGRAVSDKITDVEEYEGNISTYENSSHFTYDANGQLVKTETIHKGPDNSVEHLCQISWTNGNPTQVIWTFNNYTTTGRATYGSVENKANLDLNWLIALDTTDGWHYSIGNNQLLAVTGYMGKRSEYMAETVTETGENDNYSYTNKYQLDEEGRIAKIIRKAENEDTETITIHYAE